MIYLFSGPRGNEGARIDFDKHTERPEDYDKGITKPVDIERGTEVLIRPELAGFHFNPSQRTITFEEDLHEVKFRMQPLLKATRGEPIYGQVSFFSGKVLIGDIGINVTIKEHLSKKEKDTKDEDESSAYQTIFASYSRDDLNIVEEMEKAHFATGNVYTRDLVTVQPGRDWRDAIRKLIKEADVFQLFWSKAAKKSKYVEMEWREALKRRKKNFIRPCFWERPMPEPIPPELENINFRYVKF